MLRTSRIRKLNTGLEHTALQAFGVRLRGAPHRNPTQHVPSKKNKHPRQIYWLFNVIQSFRFPELRGNARSRVFWDQKFL